jgi:hypothetical protein
VHHAYTRGHASCSCSPAGNAGQTHLDVVVRGAVQVVRLNHLQRLVHQRGGVTRDLSTHVPVGVRGGLGMKRQRVVLGQKLREKS